MYAVKLIERGGTVVSKLYGLETDSSIYPDEIKVSAKENQHMGEIDL